MTTLTRTAEAKNLGFEDQGNFFRKIVENTKKMPQKFREHYQSFKTYMKGDPPERLPDR